MSGRRQEPPKTSIFRILNSILYLIGFSGFFSNFFRVVFLDVSSRNLPEIVPNTPQNDPLKFREKVAEETIHLPRCSLETKSPGKCYVRPAVEIGGCGGPGGFGGFGGGFGGPGGGFGGPGGVQVPEISRKKSGIVWKSPGNVQEISRTFPGKVLKCS